MKTRRLSLAAVAVGVIAVSTSCLQPGQHTLVAITAAHNTPAQIDTITFTFDQGAPTGSSARYVAQPPSAPSGKPVGVDGVAFIQVDLTVAIAHDARNVTTSPEAFYPHQTSNVVEVARYEDFEGHVGYVLGLRSGKSPRVSISRSANAVVVSLSAPS
jgi:hypothetical protein